MEKTKKQIRTKEGGLSLTSAHAGHLFHSLFCFDYFSAVVLYQIKSIDCNNSAQSACRRLVRSFFYSVINVETTMTDGDAGHIQYPIYIKCNGRKFGFSFFSVFSVIATSLLWLAGAKNKILSTLSRLIESFPVQKANGVRWHLKSISKPEDIPFLSIFPSKVLKANRIREDTNKSERLVDLCGATAESEGDNNFFSSVLFLSQVDSILFFLSVSLSLVP